MALLCCAVNQLSGQVMIRRTAAGAAEDLYCSSIITQTNYDANTCSGNIDEDPDTPDGAGSCPGAACMNAVDDGVATVLRLAMSDPASGDPTGTQTFRVWGWQSDEGGSGEPSITIGVRETGDGADDATCSAALINSPTGQMWTCDWAASVLETANGSAVEAYITCTKAGGGPNENTCDIDTVEWVKN